MRAPCACVPHGDGTLPTSAVTSPDLMCNDMSLRT
jgi:hypothetical protein